MSRTVWDLRGLEHSVAECFVDCMCVLAEDVGGLRLWWRERWRLDVPLSAFVPLAQEYDGSLEGVLCDIVRQRFRVRCYPSEIRRCATVGDLVSLVSSRLEPVPREPWRPLEEEAKEEEVTELLRRLDASLSTAPVRWGPRGLIRLHEVTEALPCWCGSGAPFLRCCGTDWRPKAGWRSRLRRYL